jgi:site-specific DNA-methyltransferase (adenine-specific)
MISEVFNEDCMEGMRRYPDGYFELAVVDPPYGIGADNKNSVKKLQSKKSSSLSKDYGEQQWDATIPTDEYFNALFRISKKQIVWGANYFGVIGGMIYWHKNVTMLTYSTGELAWVSWLNKISFIDLTWHGMLQHDMKDKEVRIHPTQKPIQLYRWILKHYAKPGDKILDTHLGSGSNRIACDMEGFDFTGFEIDKDYFDAQEKRFQNYKAQKRIEFPEHNIIIPDVTLF